MCHIFLPLFLLHLDDGFNSHFVPCPEAFKCLHTAYSIGICICWQGKTGLLKERVREYRGTEQITRVHIVSWWPVTSWLHHQMEKKSLHKGQSRGALRFSLICAWTSGWTNKREVGDLRRHRAYYDVTVMLYDKIHISDSMTTCNF